MDADSIPYNDFILALDNSVEGSGFYDCWKPLMEKALKNGRHIPVNPLAKAVHVFNRSDSKDEFSLAVYLYFKEIINGNGVISGKRKKAAEAVCLKCLLELSFMDLLNVYRSFSFIRKSQDKLGSGFDLCYGQARIKYQAARAWCPWWL